jgi:hypothetical protein
MSPAERVIDKCGGVAVVAELAGVHVSRVHRWTYPKSRGGSNGIIPSANQQRILDAARARGIDLSPDDFFDGPANTPSHEAAA